MPRFRLISGLERTIAERFAGQKEVAGSLSNPVILSMLRLDNAWPKDDSTPWCSAFCAFCCWLARFERSKSLRARSWLKVGVAQTPLTVERGDVVILSRGRNSPGPEVFEAPGHVGFVLSFPPDKVRILGGNQGDSVSRRTFSASRILGVRRLRPTTK